MAKRVDITDVSSGYQSNTTFNDNFDNLNEGFDNTLSRDGSTPNNMEADLDMDSNDILNVGSLAADELSVGGVNLVDASAVPNWEGGWATSTAYVKDDLVREDGSTYICLVAHTSGTFSTDLTANKWELFAQKGSTGGGTGDMLAANNLSDVANVATSRSNLGLGTAATTASTDYATAAQGTLADSAVQPTDTDASAHSWVVDEDDMVSDSATKVPTQQSVKAYVDAEVATANSPVGVGQSWASTTLTDGVSYQNSTGGAIQVAITVKAYASGPDNFSSNVQVSSNGSTWVTVGETANSNSRITVSLIIPDTHYYRFNGESTDAAILS